MFWLGVFCGFVLGIAVAIAVVFAAAFYLDRKRARNRP